MSPPVADPFSFRPESSFPSDRGRPLRPLDSPAPRRHHGARGRDHADRGRPEPLLPPPRDLAQRPALAVSRSRPRSAKPWPPPSATRHRRAQPRPGGSWSAGAGWIPAADSSSRSACAPNARPPACPSTATRPITLPVSGRRLSH